MRNHIIVIVGLLVCFLALVFIIFFIIARQRQNSLYTKNRLIRQEFEKQLLQTQLEIQEQTFTLISQEIHDNVGQILSLAKVQINIMNESENMNRGMLDQVKDNIGKAMTDLRDIAKSLNSDWIKSISLVDAVAGEADKINRTRVLLVLVSNAGEEKELPGEKKLILFRIIQEILQNSIKHAHASNIQISFNWQQTRLGISLTDDGQGFDVKETLATNKGLGLSNIRKRVMLIGGSSTIESELNKSTTIIINLPYE